VTKILLPVDGSAAALAAVRHVLALMQDGLRAELVLANVQEPPSLYEVVVMHDPAVLDDVRAGAGADLLAEAEALLEQAGQPYESEVAGGDPGHVLVDLIETYGCTAVVMGCHAKPAGGSAGPGRVALSVLQHSPVPVTLVPPPEPAEAADLAEEPAPAAG
jgi:nucleotide-binding universal stress UspA family protein